MKKLFLHLIQMEKRIIELEKENKELKKIITSQIMKSSNKFFLGFILFTVIIINGCRKDCTDPTNPDCSNYDPCLLQANASFNTQQYHRSFFNEAYFQEDTFLTPGRLVFTVDDETIDSCFWKVGAEIQTRRGKSILINFEQAMEEILPIRLIVYKRLEGCDDDSKRWDTLIRNIPLQHLEQTTIIGSYTGYHEDAPNDTFTITIDSMTHPFDNYTMFSIFNLPEGCFVSSSIFPYENFRDQPSILPSKTNFLFFTTFTNSECPNPKGVGKVDQINKSIIIDYSVLLGIDTINGGFIREDKKFIGQKN